MAGNVRGKQLAEEGAFRARRDDEDVVLTETVDGLEPTSVPLVVVLRDRAASRRASCG
jgi:hypothetical protein